MACPIVAYSSKDKRGKRPSMHSSPLEKEGLSVRCGCHGECRSCWTRQLCIAALVALNFIAIFCCTAAQEKKEKDWRKEIPVTHCWQARLVCGERGESRLPLSSVPSSDNSDHRTTLAASSLRCARRIESAAKSHYFHHGPSVLSAPNNPLNPLSTLA